MCNDDKPDEVMVRLSRIETRICKLMEYLGIDPKDHGHDDPKRDKRTQYGVWRPRDPK